MYTYSDIVLGIVQWKPQIIWWVYYLGKAVGYTEYRIRIIKIGEWNEKYFGIF